MLLPTGFVRDGDRLLVVDASLSAILAIDLGSGDRSVFSDSSHGSGPDLVTPRAAALDGSTLIVVDAGSGSLFAIDLATGDRSILSDTVMAQAQT